MHRHCSQHGWGQLPILHPGQGPDQLADAVIQQIVGFLHGPAPQNGRRVQGHLQASPLQQTPRRRQFQVRRRKSPIWAFSTSCLQECCKLLFAKGRTSTPSVTFQLRSTVARRRCVSAPPTRSCACSNRAVASRLGGTLRRPLSWQ